MKLGEIFEGMMKRSDPRISGELAPGESSPQKESRHPKKSAFKVRMESYAQRAKVPLATVMNKWEEAKKRAGDPNNSYYWQRVTTVLLKDLGLEH